MENFPYASKASAVRDAKKNSSGDYELYQNDDGLWAWRHVEHTDDNEPEATPEAEATPNDDDALPPGEYSLDDLAAMGREATPNEAKSAPATADEGEAKAERFPDRLRRSSIERPTKRVWAIAEELVAKDPSITRAAVIQYCVDAGIAFYTARTQYQAWRAALKAQSTSAN